jgi:O-methyltransferase involved in polyketide biosynthesis
MAQKTRAKKTIGEREFKKISPTAFNQAYMRTFYGIPYAKEMAKLVNAEEERIKLCGMKLHKDLEGVPRFEARYKGGEAVLDRFIEKHPNTQVLELGAGLSLHGLTLAKKYPGIIYIETDLSDMIHLKEAVIRKLTADPLDNLRFATANALDAQALGQALGATTTKRPLVVYCEGFIAYLSLEEKQKLAEIIKKLLVDYGGAWITPDLSESIDRRAYQISFMAGFREQLKHIEAKVGQKYDDYTFQNEVDADVFFKRNKFVIEKFSQPTNLHSLKKINLTPEMAEKIIQDIRLYGKVWAMSL